MNNNTTNKRSQSSSGNRQNAAVASPSIDLPKGGGALKGIDEKFQTNPVTGSASFSIPLPLSPSRNGSTPEINLSYDSGAGNGVFGLGWSLSVPNISRKTDKGLPQYFDNKESDVFIMSGAEDLVPIKDSTVERDGYVVRFYRPRIESGFAVIEQWTNINTKIIHWRTISADNTTRIYGESDNARIADPANERRIFKWLLEFSYDDKGNAVSYKYKSENDDNIKDVLSEKLRKGVFTNRYLKSVSYGNVAHYNCGDNARPLDYHFEVVFDYGEHDLLNPQIDDANIWSIRSDPFSNYRAGFDIRCRRRCERVLMFHKFDNEFDNAPCLVRSVDFKYDHNESEISLLTTAQQKGYIRANNGYEIKSLPAMTFTYQPHEWNDKSQTLDADSLSGLPVGLASENCHFLDLYGEGLSGVLSEVGQGWYYKRNLGGGKLGPLVALKNRPITGSAAGVTELEGDSEKYLVDYAGDIPGFYRFENGMFWTGHQTFRNLPNIDFKSPRVKMLDLDGDGRADILVDDDRVFTYYKSLGKNGFKLESQERKKVDEAKGPNIIFADYEQTIFLADMTGDGLTDIVRVRNGNVSYWPNLGHGRFGGIVDMRASPRMDHKDIFNTSRVRLADVDGSGTADLIYISHDKITVWLNKSGNSFAKEGREFRLRSDNTTQISVLDFLGQGTACIVWSSPLPCDARAPMRYIDLMNGKKPHVMIGYDNGMGKSVTLEYTPSTKYYLADKNNGKPWVTKLPFPVQCLSKVVSYDKISGHKFVNEYTYHHGYYDIDEREFRGFGRVDQIDTEHFIGANNVGATAPGRPPTHDDTDTADLNQPPVLTRTWYHLGASIKHKGILEHYISEYNPVYMFEPKLEQPNICDSWNASERREAMRAFKGMALRQEIYALDDSGLDGLPYVTTQFSYDVKQLQAKNENRHACYFVTQSESLTHYYERKTDDPRRGHSLVLESDDYGRPTLAAEIVYGREVLMSSDIDDVDVEQRKNHVVVTETRYAADVKDVDTFRMGVECCVKTWEFTHPSLAVLCNKNWLKENFANAEAIAFEAETSIISTQKRLVEHVETLFYDDTLTNALPAGTMSRHGLPYESYTLSYTQSLLTHLFGADRVDNNMLVEGGFIQRENNNWWARSGRNVYDNNATSNFYLPCGVENAFSAVTNITYDNYNLLMTSITDPLDNVVSAQNDYRTLSPVLLVDPNGNRAVIETDALGIVIKSAVMGKENSNDGDTLENPTAYMEYGFAEFDDDDNLIQPSYVKTFSRETHGDTNTRWLQQVEYSDGAGRVALAKIQADSVTAGSARWIGTGRTVLNNKGNPVKQYEPYFSDSDAWENESEIRETGVTPIMSYDPLSRLIRTDFPDDTHSKIEFTAWLQKDYDRCDTAESSPHYNTPTITHLDSLGRAFYVVTSDGINNNNIVTRTVLDIEGNEKKIIDARDNIVMEYKYGIHGEKAYTKSMDAGERCLLITADGQPLYTWDSRGHRLRVEFDDLRRPTTQKLSINGSDEIVVGKTVYGESTNNSELNNLRGQAWKVYDQSGVIENVRYDFKGNLLENKRQLTQEYKQVIDWNANPIFEDETFTTITAYDALNRATSIKTPHNKNIPANEIMPKYDDGGMLKEVNVNLRGANAPTAFVNDIVYNAKGQREKIKYGNGATTKYTYDEKTFRLTRLWTFRNGGAENLQDLNYAYDPMGNIVEIQDNAQQTTFFNGQVVSANQTFEYDALYRLTKATGREHINNNADSGVEVDGYSNVNTSMPGDATALRNYTRRWEYDSVGNILQLIHSANNGNWNRAYNYDANSNRLNNTTVGQTTVNYTHNEHGSMSSMPHLQNMEWDFAERLSHITKGTTEAYYNYDGSGERVRKVVEKGGVVETRLYLGGFEIFRKKVGNNIELERETLHVMDDYLPITETKKKQDDDNETTNEHDDDVNDKEKKASNIKRRIAIVETKTWENGTRIANLASVQRYQLGNNIESVSLELDEEANIISYEDYYPYGESSYSAGRNTVEVSQKRYRYTGKEMDEENGLYYHSTRYYASCLGRWTAADPAGLVDGINLYMYCQGNPIKYIDPIGKWLEGPLEVISITVGFMSFADNLKKGDVGGAIIDAGGIVFDVGALIVPGLPGLAGTAINSARYADNAANVARQLDNAPNNAARQTVPATETGNISRRYGSRGRPDHVARIDNLVEELQKKYAHMGRNVEIVREKKIVISGSNRRPDIQVIDSETRRLIKVYEVERSPGRSRNIRREEEYGNLGIDFETILLRTGD